jgi:F-type H+-transporting ATPase subunit b
VLIQVLVFLAAIAIINTLVLKPFSGSHSGREKRVSDTRDTAARESQLASEHRAGYDERIAKAREQAEARRQEIRGSAQAQEKKVLAGAIEASEQQLSSSREQLEAQLAAARTTLASEARNLAQEMASRVLGRSP